MIHAPEPPVSGRPAGDPTDPEHEQWAAELTVAILAYDGFTNDDCVAAVQVHPGRVCLAECWDEQGVSIHGPAHTALGSTSSTVVDVVLPWLTRLLAFRDAAAAGAAGEGLSSPESR